MSKRRNNALDGFGWTLVIVHSLLLPIPFAVVAMPFGVTVGPWIWLAMTLSWPIWEIWYLGRDFDRH